MDWPTEDAVKRGAEALARDGLMSLEHMHDAERDRLLRRARIVLEAAGEPDLPDLIGATDTAAVLGVATGNLGKVAGLPEPLYDLRSGKLYDADVIRTMAARRRRQTTTTQEG